MHFSYNKSFFDKDLKVWARLYLEKLPEEVNCLLTIGSYVKSMLKRTMKKHILRTQTGRFILIQLQ